jgi:hypothetical protein
MRAVRDPLAIAELGRLVVLRLDEGAAGPFDPEEPEELRELERLCAALDLLDALDASGAPGCWRAPTVGLA